MEVESKSESRNEKVYMNVPGGRMLTASERGTSTRSLPRAALPPRVTD